MSRQFPRIAACVIVAFVACLVPLHAAKTDLDYLHWSDTAEAYFATPEEIEALKHAISQQQFDAFISNFWAKRGAAFHQEVERRIAFADKQFAMPDRRGSETQRGRVWIILGSPSFERTDRASSGREMGAATFGGGGPNVLDQQAIVSRTWTYKTDRLPKDLGVPELVVHFQTDVRKGYETIENPGIVEPYLKKAAAHLQAAFGLLQQMSRPPAAAAATAPAPTDEQVSSASAPNGAIFTGESYISATEKPFYAVDFYLPKGSFAEVNKVTVAGVIRRGNEVVQSVRVPAEAVAYDAHGDRYVDAAVELPPGHYSGAFALATPEGRIVSASKSDFDVVAPDFVGISRTLMTSNINAFDKQHPFDPFTFVATKYAVKGDRQFHATDKIAYFTAVSNPAANPQPSMTLKMKVTKDGKPFASTPPVPADLTQTGPHTYLVATQFDAGTFKPGHYTIEIMLKDINAPKTSDAYTKGYVSTTTFDVVE